MGQLQVHLAGRATSQADLLACVKEKLQLAFCADLLTWSCAGLGREGRVFGLLDLFIILVHTPVLRP